jgi:hypothetical protein
MTTENEDLECQHHANCGGYCVTPKERETALCADCLDSDREREQMEREHSSMLEALRTIRFSGNDSNPLCIWMQKWAAWGMEPHKWPKPPAEPPTQDV